MEYFYLFFDRYVFWNLIRILIFFFRNELRDVGKKGFFFFYNKLGDFMYLEVEDKGGSKVFF